MFILYVKLKLVKAKLKSLNKESYSDISTRTASAREALNAMQEAFHLDPFNLDLAAKERECINTFLNLHLQEESFYKQKSRIKWLEEGDLNTKFFHHSVNKRHLLNRILSLRDDAGNTVQEPPLIQQLVVSHLRDLLAAANHNTLPSIHDIRLVIPCALYDSQILLLSNPVSEVEIRDSLFSLATGKAPGPDGFGVEFFRHCWDIVGPTVTSAVLDFFNTGELLKEPNNTILTLVPKCPNATTINDFRPIACCNTVYKCITKIIANRLAAVMPNVISSTQNAFVKGRRISDNILLAQELFAGFHHKPHKCAIKVDFRKAYDTLNWDFLEVTLRAFRFPLHFARLIMRCVRSPHFSVALNGELHGFFFKW